MYGFCVAFILYMMAFAHLQGRLHALASTRTHDHVQLIHPVLRTSFLVVSSPQAGADGTTCFDVRFCSNREQEIAVMDRDGAVQQENGMLEGHGHRFGRMSLKVTQFYALAAGAFLACSVWVVAAGRGISYGLRVVFAPVPSVCSSSPARGWHRESLFVDTGISCGCGMAMRCAGRQTGGCCGVMGIISGAWTEARTRLCEGIRRLCEGISRRSQEQSQ